jgi:imidazolonepropionase-like amidohydrolase
MHVKDGKIISIRKIKEYPKEIKVLDVRGATILFGIIFIKISLFSFL